MKQWLFVVLLLAVSGLVAACGSVPGVAGVAGQSNLAAPPAGIDYETQLNSENAVTVEVTPLNLAEGGPSLDFAVAFNTHSVDLAFDPAAISVLRDDQGREYPAIGWDGAGPGGHHRSGTLRFAGLDEVPTAVEVILKDVADVPERVFRWKLRES